MNKINIILAEDHSIFRKGIKMLLDDIQGMQVIHEAANGEELLLLLDDREKHPDVILMDLNMPKLNGIEATAIIHKKYPNIKIIALTLYNEKHFIEQVVESGADGFLFKNAEIEEVETAIRDVIANGFYFNEEMLTTIGRSTVLKPEKTTNNNTNKLSNRELEILRFICKELTNTEIAEKLYLSTRTVDGYRRSLLEKTGVRNTAGLVVYAIKNKLLNVGF